MKRFSFIMFPLQSMITSIIISIEKRSLFGALNGNSESTKKSITFIQISMSISSSILLNIFFCTITVISRNAFFLLETMPNSRDYKFNTIFHTNTHTFIVENFIHNDTVLLLILFQHINNLILSLETT